MREVNSYHILASNPVDMPLCKTELVVEKKNGSVKVHSSKSSVERLEKKVSHEEVRLSFVVGSPDAEQPNQERLTSIFCAPIYLHVNIHELFAPA